MRSIFLIAGTLLLVCALSPRLDGPLFAADNTATAGEGVQFYKDKVRPILIQNCFKCHTDDPLSHLRVDSRAALLLGGKRGPAIVPGDPEKSLLIEAVRQTGDLKMPKNGKLDERQVADLVAWVKMGAPWDPDEASQPLPLYVSAAAAGSSVGEDFFETKIRPIFANVCSNCHGDTATSGLRVFSRETLLQGGRRGPAIVPNDPEKSLMIQAVRQTGPKNAEGRKTDARGSAESD
jgi:mono/diheme cytochrome c family protein